MTHIATGVILVALPFLTWRVVLAIANRTNN